MIILRQQPKIKDKGDTTRLHGSAWKAENGKRESFYFCFAVNKKNISIQRSNVPTMVNAVDLDETDTFDILKAVIKKSKDRNVLQYVARMYMELKELYKHQQAVQNEPLDTTLVDTNICGKVKPIYKPLYSESKDGKDQQVKGAMTGQLCYLFELVDGDFYCIKSSSLRFMQHKQCTDDEVRFILNALIETYPDYRDKCGKMLQRFNETRAAEAEKHRTYILQSEFRREPIAFLSNTELIQGIRNVGPASYQDPDGQFHLIYKEAETVYHLTTDKPNPTVEKLFSYQQQLLRYTALTPVVRSMVDKCQKIKTFIATKLFKKPAPGKISLNVGRLETISIEDTDKLAQTLTREDVQNAREAGHYPQLDDKNIMPTLGERISRNNTPFNAAVRQRVSAKLNTHQD